MIRYTADGKVDRSHIDRSPQSPMPWHYVCSAAELADALDDAIAENATILDERERLWACIKAADAMLGEVNPQWTVTKNYSAARAALNVRPPSN